MGDNLDLKLPDILIADAAPEKIGAAIKLLKETGYAIRLASHGKEVLDLIEMQLPGLILLDADLSEGNGFEICRKIRETEAYLKIPIIFTLNDHNVQWIDAGLKAGGQEYLIKPFHPVELLVRVQTQLKLNLHTQIEMMLAESLTRLSVLYEVFRQTTEQRDFDALIRETTAILKNHLGVDCVAFFIIEEKSSDIVLHSSLGVSAEHFANVQRRKMGEGGVGMAIVTGKPLAMKFKDLPEGPVKHYPMQDGLTDLFAYPVFAGGKPIAVIGISNKNDRPIPETDQELLMAVGGHLGAVIHNAKLFVSLAESEEKYRVLVESSRDLIYSIDLQGKLLSVNHAFEDLFGVTKEHIIGKKIATLITDLDALAIWQDNFTQVIHSGEALTTNYIFTTPTARKIVFHVTLMPVFNAKREVIAVTGTNHDVSELVQKEETIQQLAYYDVLTGLPNRSLFSDKVRAAILRAKISSQKLVVMFVDLDNFKKVNDTLGHPMGDLLLQEITQRLQRLVRESDIIARMGGDEFAILMSNFSQKQKAAELALRIMKAIEQPFSSEGHTYHLSGSLGIAIYPGDGQTYEELLKSADTAMYKAKEAGRNNFQFFTGLMKEEIDEKVDLENSLRQAFPNKELNVEFQPQIDSRTGEFRGVEALMRWHSWSYGPVGPDRFIPILEETGMIVPFGEWILEDACRKNKAWQQKGYKPIMVSVNISSAQLKQKNFVERVKAILAKTGLEASYLELEITESVLIDNFDQVVQKLTELKAIGVKVALDDFGTGYCSLNYLRRLPIHALKIDKSFVWDLSENKREQDIIGTIIDLAHKLGIEVIAEGVETREQKDYLTENECDYLQGFYLCRPSGESSIAEMIHNGAELM